MRWMHISDIHYNPAGDGRSSSQLREKLPDYLKDLEIQVDEVFVTGDFRFAKEQGDTDEVAKAAVAFVRELAKSVGVRDSKNIHVVPGNHDITRLVLEEDKGKLSDIRKGYSFESGNFPHEERDYLLKRFSFFRRICTELYSAGDSAWSKNPNSIHTYHYCEKNNIFILYLNTVISYNADEDHGHLLMGNNDLYEVLKEIRAKDKEGLIIALAHHGMEYLAKRERQIVENLFKDYSVNFYLCGDNHDVWHRRINETMEITMGCIKQDKSVQAAFSIGKMGEDGFIEINAHHWDSQAGDWGLYTQFNNSIKKSLPQRYVQSGGKHIVTKIFGRETEIDNVYKALCFGRAVEVFGPAGIGKSTICRAVMAKLDSAMVRGGRLITTRYFNPCFNQDNRSI